MAQKPAYASPKFCEIGNNSPMLKLLPFVLLILLLGGFPVLANALDQYSVRFDGGLEKVYVQVCFEGSAPKRIYHSSHAAEFASELKTPTGTFKIQKDADSSRLPRLAPDSCLEWQLDLEKAAAQADFRFAMRVGEDLVTDTDLWFWRGAGDRPARVGVELPAGINISVPWKLTDLSGTGLSGERIFFEPANTPASWASRIAVGRFANQTLKTVNSEIRFALLGGLDAPVQDKLTQWLEQAVMAVAGVYGQFPQTSPQVLIIPIGARNNPVPWAHVMRGGGVSAEFFVDQTRPLNELSEDWTACHELSHMLLPFISSKDRWLSEGLASYYQYILLARTGMLTEQQAWQGMFDGLKRGENGTRSGRRASTLADATLEGRENTMRIYWSGAAMMLMADTQIRAASGNLQSLDTALASLKDCCLEDGKRWRAGELFKRLDSLTGKGIFGALYDEHVQSKQFPDLSATWHSLGIEIRSKRVWLNDHHAGSDIRKTIMKN